TEQLLRGLIGEANDPVAVDDRDAVREAVDDRSQSLAIRSVSLRVLDFVIARHRDVHWVGVWCVLRHRPSVKLRAGRTRPLNDVLAMVRKMHLRHAHFLMPIETTSSRRRRWT